MKKFYLVSVLLFAILFSSNIKAQRTCAAHDLFEHQMENNPEMQKNQAALENYASTYSKSKVAGSTRIIPVYVHVLYKTAQENISDAQIQSQISVLNKDYGGTNTDIITVPSIFTSVVATGTGIQFTLAGIDRKYVNKTSWGTADAMKKLSQGGTDPITPSTHLNMWICNIGGGILGYAQFPGGASATDGVVFSPQYCGSSDYGTSFYLSAPFDKGRTATHEIGHYLNLRHIWGDGNCSATDYVADTPNAAASNYGCPTFPTRTCTGTTWTSDMYMNYMDYTDDNCMFMFSDGQDTRMWACLTSSRSSLGTSGTVTATAPSATSVAASSIAQTTAILNASVNNNSATSTAISFEYGTTTSYGSTATGTPSTATGTSATTATASLTGLVANTKYYFRVKAVNSVGTTYGSQLSFTTLATTVLTAPTVTTTAMSAITTTTASSGGNVTADGGATVTAKGVCWSTTSNPTIANSKTANGTGTGTFTSALTGLTLNTTYYLRAYATNSVGTSYGAQQTFTTLNNTAVTYCASKGTSIAYEWIDLVQIGTLNNVTTAKPASGYSNFTALTAPNLGLSSVKTIYVSAAFASTAYTEYFKVYVDYNKNGVFTDAGELVASTSSKLTTNLTMSFTVPATATLGTTRMRVVMSDASATTSCGTYSYGETEDYTVNISPAGTREENPFGIDAQNGDNNVFEHITVYPNPANDIINIAVDASTANGSVIIYNINGQIVKTENINSINTEVNISNLPAGIYTVKIDDGEKGAVKHIIKK